MYLGRPLDALRAEEMSAFARHHFLLEALVVVAAVALDQGLGFPRSLQLPLALGLPGGHQRVHFLFDPRELKFLKRLSK